MMQKNINNISDNNSKNFIQQQKIISQRLWWQFSLDFYYFLSQLILVDKHKVLDWHTAAI